MTYQRGDVVEVGDPFNEDNPTRPFVIVSTDSHPFHGEQYVAMTLTTRTWYDGIVSLSDEDFLEGEVPKDSSIVPWGLVSPDHADVLDRFGRLESEPVDEAVDRLQRYLEE